jgi:hypothetical protein
MTMFPGFPVLFPARSQSGPVDSRCSQRSASSATITVDAMPSYFPYVQALGTLGTSGTALKRSALVADLLWNKSGNARNTHAPRHRIRHSMDGDAIGEWHTYLHLKSR